jgi:hypothetical protein
MGRITAHTSATGIYLVPLQCAISLSSPIVCILRPHIRFLSVSTTHLCAEVEYKPVYNVAQMKYLGTTVINQIQDEIRSK